MEFRFTDEQLMIRDTAAGFLAEISSAEAVRKAMATERGFDDAVWSRITGEMYWQAITIPEQFGGLGLGYVELAAVLEQMGKHLLCSPFLSTVGLAVNALLVAGNDEQKAEFLPQFADGSLTGTLAYTGRSGKWCHEAVEATYRKTAAGYELDGVLRYIPDGHTAGLLVIAAREQGSSDQQGISLFLVDASSPGVTRTWLPTMDQTRKQAEIVLSNVAVPATRRMGEEGNAWPQLARIIALANIAVAAEQMGGAQQVLDMSVAYTKERVQFGRPIASFQAIKHKAADMMLRCEVARSAVYYAACVAQEALEGASNDAQLLEAASMAKAYCSDAYFFNAGCGIQMHGGVGFTWEYDVHLYFKRAKSSETFLGNGAYHRELVARTLLD
jgi:alkylation response protein AidB-like acyl-CoA dehydrogenase